MLPPPHRAALLAGLVLVVTLAGCTQPPPAADIRVGVLLPLTGPLAQVGAFMRAAVERAAEEVRGAGGIEGRPLTLQFEDVGLDPGQAVQAAQRVRDAGARAIVGTVASGPSKAILDVAAPAGIAVVSPGSTSPEFTAINAAQPLGERVFFRTVPSDALKAKVAAAYALQHGWARVALLHDNNPYGNGLEATFRGLFAGAGRNLTSVAFDEGRASYDDALQRALRDCAGAADPDCPDALFFVGYSREAVVAVRDWWARPAWRHVPWFFSELERETFTTLVAANVTVAGFEGLQAAGAGARFQEYRAVHTADPPPFSANAYDAMMLVALALEVAALRSRTVPEALREVGGPGGNEVGPADFASAVGILRKGEAVDYDGAAGNMDFDALGDVTTAFEVFRVTAEGAMARRCLVPAEAVAATPVALPPDCA